MALAGPPPGAGAPGTGGDRLEAVLDALERDRERHLLAPCTEEDLACLEADLGGPLPPDYRRLLSRLGGGLYYDRHEVFGVLRLMVHDIELVPGVLGMKCMLSAASGRAASPFLLPLHRDGDAVSWLDLQTGRVEGPGGPHADLATFLASAVLQD